MGLLVPLRCVGCKAPIQTGIAHQRGWFCVACVQAASNVAMLLAAMMQRLTAKAKKGDR